MMGDLKRDLDDNLLETENLKQLQSEAELEYLK